MNTPSFESRLSVARTSVISSGDVLFLVTLDHYLTFECYFRPDGSWHVWGTDGAVIGPCVLSTVIHVCARNFIERAFGGKD